MIYSPRPDGGPAAQASPSMPPHSPSICCPGDRNASAPVPGTAGRRAVTSPETQRRPPTGLRGYASLRLIRSASGRFESPGQTDRLLILNWGKLKSARSADPATLRDPAADRLSLRSGTTGRQTRPPGRAFRCAGAPHAALPGDSSETLLRPVGIDGLRLPGLHSSVPPEPLRLAAMPSHSSPFCCPETGSCGSCPRTARRRARTSLRVSALSGSTPGNAFAPRRQLSSALSAMPSRSSPFCCPETGSFGPASGQRVGGLGHRLRALRCCLCFAPGNGGSDAWRFYCRSFSVQLFARPSPRLWPHRLAQTRQLRRSWHSAKDRPCVVLGLRLCAYSRQETS